MKYTIKEIMALIEDNGHQIPRRWDWDDEGFEKVCEWTDIEEQKEGSYEGYEPDWWTAVYVYRKGDTFVARMWSETRYTASYDDEYIGGITWEE